MKSLAWLLIILGAAIAGTALVMAVLELGKIYSEAVNDPMGNNSPEPQDRARTMLTYAIIGLPGIMISVTGTILRLRARLRARPSA